MKITKNTVVTLRFTVFDAQGNLLEDSDLPISYLHGGYEEIFPRVEEALAGQEIGYQTLLHLEPEDAFGEYDTQQMRVEARRKFPEPIEIGMQFEGIPDADEEDGLEGDGKIFIVTDLAEDQVVLDANHPYAGMALRFEVRVLDVRAAEPEEIALERALSAAELAGEDEDSEEHDADLDAQIEARRNQPPTLH